MAGNPKDVDISKIDATSSKIKAKGSHELKLKPSSTSSAWLDFRIQVLMASQDSSQECSLINISITCF